MNNYSMFLNVFAPQVFTVNFFIYLNSLQFIFCVYIIIKHKIYTVSYSLHGLVPCIMLFE